MFTDIVSRFRGLRREELMDYNILDDELLLLLCSYINELDRIKGRTESGQTNFFSPSDKRIF